MLQLAKAEGKKEAEKAISHIDAPSKRTKIDHRPIKTEPLDDAIVIDISDDESLSRTTTTPIVKQEEYSSSSSASSSSHATVTTTQLLESPLLTIVIPNNESNAHEFHWHSNGKDKMVRLPGSQSKKLQQDDKLYPKTYYRCSVDKCPATKHTHHVHTHHVCNGF